MFIHGGYWQSLSKDRYSFVAGPLLKFGFSVAVLGYPLAPDAAFPEIITSVLSGLSAVTALLDAENNTPNGIVVSGHSAGGHLAACAALRSQKSAISALVPISGIFDLEPIIETSLNGVLGLDSVAARTLSPIKQPPPAMPITAFVGGSETAEFVSQSRRFVDHCVATGSVPAEMISIDKANHYSILLDFLQQESKIARKINDLMKRRGLGAQGV